MLTIRSILCPIDFSDHAREALRWAIVIAAKHHARITVLAAVEPLLAHTARARWNRDLAREDTLPTLRDFASGSFPQHAPWAPEISLEAYVGDPCELILASAARVQADVIVMGTHGLSGFRKLLLGSTTERVLRQAAAPVLAVPLVEPPLVLIDAGGARFEKKAIVAATDFSDAAENAVKCAATLAHQESVPLVLVHAVAPVMVPAAYRMYVEGVEEEFVRQGQMRLEKLAAGLADSAAADVVVPLGRPAESITSTAVERGAGLIVMGLTGAHGAPALRIGDSGSGIGDSGLGTRDARHHPGSIAYRVLCLAQIPVLVVPLRS